MQVVVEEGVAKNGSHLSGVSAVCSWEDQLGRPGSAFLPGHMTNGDTHGIRSESGVAAELLNTVTLDKVHVKFNVEAARLLPLAIRFLTPGSMFHDFTMLVFHAQRSFKTWSSFYLQEFCW